MVVRPHLRQVFSYFGGIAPGMTEFWVTTGAIWRDMLLGEALVSKLFQNNVLSHVHCVSKKFPPLNSLQLCQMLTDFQIFALLESIWNLLQNPFDNAHRTLGMLVHYHGKLDIQIFCRCSADIAEMQTYCILIASNFVVQPQILTFSVFKIASLSSYWFQIKVLSKCCSRRFVRCWLLRDTAVTSAVTNFRCHKLIAKVNK